MTHAQDDWGAHATLKRFDQVCLLCSAVLFAHHPPLQPLGYRFNFSINTDVIVGLAFGPQGDPHLGLPPKTRANNQASRDKGTYMHVELSLGYQEYACREVT